jgi:rubrerythrin/VIT1/CCC1 family predicted Fe2+/Mn2+ transporter
MTEPARARTDANLEVAVAGEADANRRYVAYGIQALNEGYPEVAELFFEAAGAETVHALTHLKTLGAVRSTRENLERAARGEMLEIDVVLPRMIREAEEEGRDDAAASFRLALERERYHRDMFRNALARLDGAARPVGPAPPAAPRPLAPAARPAETALGARPADGRAHVQELETEPRRLERLGSIREVVFGAQDGMVSTLAVVAGLAAAGADHLVVLLAGAVSAVAGVLSMSIGTFLSSRAQQQVYAAEIARERHEIREHPGEETAELIAALTAGGMARADAVEVGRRVARHPDLLLGILGALELGLAPRRHGSPVRDAFVMAASFGGFSVIPLLPFTLRHVMTGLAVSAVVTLAALFAVGAIKARIAAVSPLRSGLEVVALGTASALIGFGLGRLASVALGVEIG